jgi:hypothetical protein
MSLADEELDEIEDIERLTGGNAGASATCHRPITTRNPYPPGLRQSPMANRAPEIWNAVLAA